VTSRPNEEGRRLNATAASLLGFLHWGPMSGWDLAATAEHVIGDFWSLTKSQVYRELAWMAEDGLIERGERGSRERQPYALTDAGRAAFATWADAEPGMETIRFPLLMKISFGRHVSAERLAEFVREHRAVHAGRLREYEEHAAETTIEDRDVYREATFAFGLAYERAVLAWFDALPDEITGPADAAGDARESGRRSGRSGRGERI
jgi:DNA-binding PadR family transcriptional regulator